MRHGSIANRRYRLTEITTETGEEITADYSPAAAVSGEPGSDSSNTTLAYPVCWFATETTNRRFDRTSLSSASCSPFRIF